MFEPRKPRARILIVEGDRRVRRSLSGILEASDLVEVVGCASTATDAVDLTRERCPDAVLIDLDRPDAESWLDSLPTVRGACPDAAIVVLSATAVLHEAALRAGADTFLSKFEVAETLSEAVVAALDASPGLVNPLS
jgi:DNA-binding NarL/FixJ family response regulator